MNYVLMMATALCLAAAPLAAQTGNTGGTTDPNVGGQSTQGGTTGGQTGATGGQTGTTDPNAAGQTGTQYGSEQTPLPGFAGGVSRDEIMRIGRERNLSSKDASHAAVIAQRSGRSFTEVLDARKGEQDWKELAKQFNVEWRDVKKDVRNMDKELKRAGYNDRSMKTGTERGAMEGNTTTPPAGSDMGTGTGGTVEPGTR